MIPYEMIDDEIELSGAPVSDYCELPVDSPLRDTKKKWCEDLKTQDDNDIAVVGMWGDSAQFFTRDSIVFVAVQFVVWIIESPQAVPNLCLEQTHGLPMRLPGAMHVGRHLAGDNLVYDGMGM